MNKQYSGKDKIFLILVVLIAFSAGVLLLSEITSFKQQEQLQSIQTNLSKIKK